MKALLLIREIIFLSWFWALTLCSNITMLSVVIKYLKALLLIREAKNVVCSFCEFHKDIMFDKNKQKRNSSERTLVKKERSCTISIPHLYLDSVGLKAGDKVKLRIGKGLELIVTPLKRDESD